MSGNYLIVPVTLDALKLQNPETVQSEAADFSRLPWCSGKLDYNSDMPYLGASLVQPPFQNKNLTLNKGVHLHWALPVAHRTSPPGQEQIAFPTAPNRWLITRTNNDAKKQWIVESDYMSPTTGNDNYTAITVPVQKTNIDTSNSQPFMYLGRQLTLEEWQIEDKSKLHNCYWLDIQNKPFTAMGYGEMSFNTFYPNCRSVFGFFDHEAPDGAKYEVLGWYSTPSDDILANADSLKKLLEEYHWKVDGSSCPTASLYFGSISSDAFESRQSPPEISGVAVGNTSTEAMSAFIANTLSQEQKNNIEEQLEAILTGHNSADKPDALPRFLQSRHDKGFNTENAGYLWVLQCRKTAADQNIAAHKCTQTSGQQSLNATLPTSLANLLDALNVAQKNYNQTSNELHTAQFQLYSDWHKYMMCCYPTSSLIEDFPDPEHIRRFINMTSLPRVTNLQDELGKLSLTRDANTQIALTASQSQSTSNTVSKASLAVNAFNALKSAITTENQHLAPQDKHYEINIIPSDSYVTPADPVVLFAGNSSACAHLETLTDEALNCLFADGLTNGSGGLPVAFDEVKELINSSSIQDDFSTNASHWHPQILEWLVSFYPVMPGSNISSSDAKYCEKYINDNFTLHENSYDFTQQPNVARVACEYTGKTYLSANTSNHYRDALKNYLLRRYTKLESENFATSINTVWTTYPNENQDYSNPGYTAVQAYKQLDNHFFLTQSISGFHQSLLQHKNHLSVPMCDPLGFADDQLFSQTVAAALAGAYTAAPIPDDLFMPIRSGTLTLDNLAISDHFGQVNQPVSQHIIPSNTLSTIDSIDKCWLAPRLAQASRLNFQLLKATISGQQSNGELSPHITSTPICGWIMANYLDNSLVFYNADGRNIGSIDNNGTWNTVPGEMAPVTQEQLTLDNPAHLNIHLLKLLMYVLNTAENNDNYICDLVNALQSAQQNIHPENFTGNQAISLLMGKPIAIVRSSLNLETKGDLCVDQGWTAIRASLENAQRTSANFDQVKFPIRLGEYRRLNDGLIGYFIEENDGYKDDTLYINDSLQASFNKDTIAEQLSGVNVEVPDRIQTFLQNRPGTVKREDFVNQFKDDGANLFDRLVTDHLLTLQTLADDKIKYYSQSGLLQQSLSDEPVYTTMLMDPHGIVHASTGILPVCKVQIPPEFISVPLKNIDVNFFTSPIITPTNKLQLSLPKEEDKKWQWVQNIGSRKNPNWLTVPNKQVITKSDFNNAWHNFIKSSPQNNHLSNSTPWQELLDKNWLTPFDNSETYYLVIFGNTHGKIPLVIWQSQSNNINNIIADNATGLSQFNYSADFSEQHIVEGWSKLSN